MRVSRQSDTLYRASGAWYPEERPQPETVFRLEDRDGVGPYSWDAERSPQFQEMMTHHLQNTPEAMDDAIDNFSDEDNIPHDYLFGFDSLEQLRKRFHPRYHKALKDEGFVVRQYQADPRAIERRSGELIFHRDSEPGVVVPWPRVSGGWRSDEDQQTI